MQPIFQTRWRNCFPPPLPPPFLFEPCHIPRVHFRTPKNNEQQIIVIFVLRASRNSHALHAELMQSIKSDPSDCLAHKIDKQDTQFRIATVNVVSNLQNGLIVILYDLQKVPHKVFRLMKSIWLQCANDNTKTNNIKSRWNEIAYFYWVIYFLSRSLFPLTKHWGAPRHLPLSVTIFISSSRRWNAVKQTHQTLKAAKARMVTKGKLVRQAADKASEDWIGGQAIQCACGAHIINFPQNRSLTALYCVDCGCLLSKPPPACVNALQNKIQLVLILSFLN